MTGANGDPSGWNSIYNCASDKSIPGDSNFKGYCSTKVDNALNAANNTGGSSGYGNTT